MVHLLVLLNLLSLFGINFFSFQALECLVRLASVRRSLFTNDAARSKFLAHLMTGTKVILQTGQGVVGLLLLHLFCIVMTNWTSIIIRERKKMSFVSFFFGFLVTYWLWAELNKRDIFLSHFLFMHAFVILAIYLCLGLFNLCSTSSNQSVISCQCRNWEFQSNFCICGLYGNL